MTISSSALPRRGPETTETGEWDVVDVWGQDSFPASDAPANW